MAEYAVLYLVNDGRYPGPWELTEDCRFFRHGAGDLVPVSAVLLAQVGER